MCFLNQKGGTRKTTVGINAAVALFNRGRDVLFVDVNPRNATGGLGILHEYDARRPQRYST